MRQGKSQPTSSWDTTLRVVRPGASVGYVGVPHSVKGGLDLSKMFGRNVNVPGGVAPVRIYIPELVADALNGKLDPSPVFTSSVPLSQIETGYAAMDSRTEIKVLVRPGE